jgi:ornithine cyclodeaminase
MEAAVVADPGAALAEVGLVVTATTSREPVLPGAVAEGTFVAAVGSFEPEAAELPPIWSPARRSSWTRWRGRGRRQGI